jgi:integrase
LGWFVEKYLASDVFNPASKNAYAEGTRYNYRKHLDLLKARLGGGMLVDLDQEAVEVYSAEVAREHGPSAGDDQIAMISNVWEHAKGFKEFKRKGRINPTTRITRHYQHDGEGHLTWPDEVIEAFDQDCAAHLQFVRLGLHYTGQRGGDVAAMKWTDFDGKRIHVVQEKTGTKLWLNCPKPLLVALKREQRKTNREYIFHHAYDAPFANAQTLSHAIRNRLHALGYTDYVMHGLRKNAGMELALAGCTVPEIMAVLGHKTPKMALFYVQQAQQETMNENAVVKWDAGIEKRTVKAIAKKRAMLRAVS